jgi:uncharacterized peroxidase-related enzyme
MSFYPSLPDSHHLVALWKRFPRGIEALLGLHDAFLRNEDSELTVAERELIAAHVSTLNGCRYCAVAHQRYATAFGIQEEVFADMAVDSGHGSLSPRMQAALDYAAKLTLEPAAVARADFDTLLAAGWSEDAIHDIVCITGIYALMNRLLEGSGMKENVAPPGFTPEKARAGRYSDMLQMIQGKRP